MVRTPPILALATVAWLTGSVCCAEGEIGPIITPPAPQEEWLHETPPETWPSRPIVTESRPAIGGLLGEIAIPMWTPNLSLAAPTTRYMGWGRPLSETSWRNRPWYFGGFFGGFFGDDLIAHRIDQDVGIVGGSRFGYDFEHYWGGEARIAYATAAIDDGITPPPARNAEAWSFDGNVMLYPWGDSQVRPYLSIGAGAWHVRFRDADGFAFHETLFQIPLGVGVKYLYERWFALRADLTHNVVLGAAGLDTMDNVSATAGFEIHFGARPRSYFPW